MYNGATTVHALRWELLMSWLSVNKKSRLHVWHVWQSDAKQSLSHEHVRIPFLLLTLLLTPISEHILWLPHHILFSEILTLTYCVCCVASTLKMYLPLKVLWTKLKSFFLLIPAPVRAQLFHAANFQPQLLAPSFKISSDRV